MAVMNNQQSAGDRSTAPVIVALGGNALAPESEDSERRKLPDICQQLAGFVNQGLLLTHGNGPQIGLLAEKFSDEPGFSLAGLNAQTEGWLGHAIETELSNVLTNAPPITTLLTSVETDPEDPAFENPTKPIGDWVDVQTALALQKKNGWKFTRANDRYRRLVPSPAPRRCRQLDAIKTLLAANHIVICAGGGGIPVYKDEDGCLRGASAVIDKDHVSAMLGIDLQASQLILATDVEGIYSNWDEKAASDPDREPIREIQTAELRDMKLESGSMGPKAEAASAFAEGTGNPALIGSVKQLAGLLQRRAGTCVLP